MKLEFRRTLRPYVSPFIFPSFFRLFRHWHLKCKFGKESETAKCVLIESISMFFGNKSLVSFQVDNILSSNAHIWITISYIIITFHSNKKSNNWQQHRFATLVPSAFGKIVQNVEYASSVNDLFINTFEMYSHSVCDLMEK